MDIKMRDCHVVRLGGTPRNDKSSGPPAIACGSGRWRAGFTIIELIVVMAIIAILASIAITSTLSSIPKARDAQRKNDLKQLQTALQVYFQDNSIYPSVSSCTSSTENNSCWIKLFGDPPNTTYIKQMPQDPGNSTYTYCSSALDQYILVAKLEYLSDSDINGANTCSSASNAYWVTNP